MDIVYHSGMGGVLLVCMCNVMFIYILDDACTDLSHRCTCAKLRSESSRRLKGTSAARFRQYHLKGSVGLAKCRTDNIGVK